MGGGTGRRHAVTSFLRDNPDAAADILALYGVDPFSGVRTVLLEGLCERLSYEPFSLWRARQLGGEEWFGWGVPESQRADLIDRASMSAKGVGRQGRLRDSELAPRPKQESKPVVLTSSNWDQVAAVYAGM